MQPHGTMKLTSGLWKLACSLAVVDPLAACRGRQVGVAGSSLRRPMG